MSSDIAVVLESTMRLSVPLLFVALGELIAERSGSLNISVEGMMLGAAFGAAAGSSLTGSPWGGLAFGLASGFAVALLQAQLSHRLTINQFVIGLTLNILVLGLTSFLFSSLTISPDAFPVLSLPLLSGLPVVGKALFSGPLPFFAIYVLVPVVWWILQRSRWGLDLRACGEGPAAAQVSGVPVNRRRREAIYVCGLFAGLGGTYLSIGVIGVFSPNMTAGRGFIAIAAVIFGAWTVRGTVLGCLVFGGADALRLALPAIGVTLNPQLLISAPYLLALLTMILFARGDRQPRTLGIAFEGAPS